MSILNNVEDEVAELLAGRHTVLGLSDAGAHASQLCDACFSTYMLGRWVREKRAIPMERAIWMLSARPAEVFGITDLRQADARPCGRCYDLRSRQSRRE